MKAQLETGKNIYEQIAQSIEDDILTGSLQEEEAVPSTNQFAKFFTINPATAAKGVNMLVDAGILYKKRGIGMYVCTGARKMIQQQRKQEFYEKYIVSLLQEADKLDISREELRNMIEKGEDL